MYSIPTEVVIDEQSFAIANKGDFRMVLDCFVALNDEALSKRDRLLACLINFYEDLDSVQDLTIFGDNLEEAVKKMFDFFNCGEADDGLPKPYTLVDWDNDAQLISSAVNKVAGKEVRMEEFVHWWTFMGYYMSIGECAFSTIVGIRKKIVTGQKLEKHERKFRMENPQYFNWDFRTVADKEADAAIAEMWNSGK